MPCCADMLAWGAKTLTDRACHPRSSGERGGEGGAAGVGGVRTVLSLGVVRFVGWFWGFFGTYLCIGVVVVCVLLRYTV